MDITADEITKLIESELTDLDDRRIVDHIRGVLIPPEVQLRPWDYGPPDTSYPCWMVLKHRASNTGIAYSEYGFGPKLPWGLLFLEGDRHMSMGMDSGWFGHFLDAFFECVASTELPIWRVFQRKKGESSRLPISDEGEWDNTWKMVMRLRKEDPQSIFDCDQSVYKRKG